MARSKILAGTKPKGTLKPVALEDMVGKTVQSVIQVGIEGEFGDETHIYLVFTDGTRHGFVIPNDED